VVSEMVACAFLAALIVVARVVDPGATQPMLAVVRAVAAGAFRRGGRLSWIATAGMTAVSGSRRSSCVSHSCSLLWRTSLWVV
jgi:hypothetical protein